MEPRARLGRRKLRSHAAALFALLAAGPTASPQAVPESETWVAEPLLRTGDTLPGGKSVVAIGQQYWIGSGGLAFWARFGPNEKKDWGLYSWREGAIRLIAQEDVPFTEPDGLSKAVSRDVAWSSASTIIVPGANHLYLQFTVQRRYRVYSWDGERLASVLAPGESLRIREASHRIATTRIATSLAPALPSPHEGVWTPLDERGRVLVEVETAEPHKTTACFALDGSTAALVAAGGDIVAGGTLGGVDCARVKVFGDRTVLPASVTSGQRTRWGYCLLGPDTSAMLVADGDPHPLRPEKKINPFLSVIPVAPEKLILDDDNGTACLYRGAWKRVFGDVRELRFGPEISRPRVAAAWDVDPSGPGVLIAVKLGRAPVCELGAYLLVQKPGAEPQALSPGGVGHCDLYYFDGERAEPVPWAPLTPLGTDGLLKRAREGVPALLWTREPGGLALHVGQSAEVKKEGSFRLGDIGPKWWLPFSGPKPLKPTSPPGPARGVLADGRTLEVRGVVGRPSATEAVVALDDGIYRLRRQAGPHSFGSGAAEAIPRLSPRTRRAASRAAGV